MYKSSLFSTSQPQGISEWLPSRCCQCLTHIPSCHPSTLQPTSNCQNLHLLALMLFQSHGLSLDIKGGLEGRSGEFISLSTLNQELMGLCLVTQLCPTLCDPMNCSPPGCSVHGDSPGQNTGAGCHDFLQGIFPTQRLNPGLLHCGRYFTIWATREAWPGIQISSNSSSNLRYVLHHFPTFLAH